MDIGNIVFNTKVVKIYHEKQLIGAGIFDEGKSSIAGITNIVHPNYTKYALGKYIMLQKYIYAGEQDMLYYYPGYFMPEYPIFNYKLFIDKAATEVYLFVLKKWIPYLQFEELWQSYATQLILLAGDESIF